MPAKSQPDEAAVEAPATEDQPVRVTPGLTAAEEARLGELKAKVAAASGDSPVSRLKVEPPHSSITFGGVTVGTEFTDVPSAAAADLVSEAAAAGVTITQES
jgi:hypothetical protein